VLILAFLRCTEDGVEVNKEETNDTRSVPKVFEPSLHCTTHAVGLQVKKQHLLFNTVINSSQLFTLVMRLSNISFSVVYSYIRRHRVDSVDFWL